MTDTIQQPVEPYLAVNAVSKGFGRIRANRDISLAVAGGEICGLLGPNGAGKTTLIRQCAGWLEPDAGTITLRGIRQTSTERRTRRIMGIVSADAPLYPELTVREALTLQGTLYELSGRKLRTAVEQALANYQTEPFADRQIGKLSTGMRQRVAIAAALLHQPAVVLLDEPTAGLDPEIRQEIWAGLRQAAAGGTALILTTHYLEEAARLCSHIHLLINGTIAVSLRAGERGHSADELEQAYLQAVAYEAPRGESRL